VFSHLKFIEQGSLVPKGQVWKINLSVKSLQRRTAGVYTREFPNGVLTITHKDQVEWHANYSVPSAGVLTLSEGWKFVDLPQGEVQLPVEVWIDEGSEFRPILDALSISLDETQSNFQKALTELDRISVAKEALQNMRAVLKEEYEAKFRLLEVELEKQRKEIDRLRKEVK